MIDSVRRWLCGLCVVVALSPVPVIAADIAQDVPADAVDRFIERMVSVHGFDRQAVTVLLAGAQRKQKILDAISRPAEGKPWYQYRPIFVTPERSAGGVRFWQQNADALARAEQQFGVDAAVVVAILGVETRYGRHSGSYRVLDSLYTLGFFYPKRADFFRRELEQFLLLAREEGIDPTALKGSYAGAMGLAQFISSSYRHYAVDFDGDGTKDLWQTPADAIGSIGHYLQQHGWQRGQAIAAPADVATADISGLSGSGLKPETTVGAILDAGVRSRIDANRDQVARLLALQGRDGPEYWLTLKNFYVITRYNHSPLYAMAVFQLAEAIRDGRPQ